MTRLTPLGKLTLGVVAVVVLYAIISFVLPLFTGLGYLIPDLPGTPGGGGGPGQEELDITVYVASFDRDSVAVVDTLRDLALDAQYRGRFIMRIVNVNKDFEQAQAAGVTATPTIEIEGELFAGKKSTQWFKDQIDARTK